MIQITSKNSSEIRLKGTSFVLPTIFAFIKMNAIKKGIIATSLEFYENKQMVSPISIDITCPIEEEILKSSLDLEREKITNILKNRKLKKELEQRNILKNDPNNQEVWKEPNVEIPAPKLKEIIKYIPQSGQFDTDGKEPSLQLCYDFWQSEFKKYSNFTLKVV